jgi:hypothetical protein
VRSPVDALSSGAPWRVIRKPYNTPKTLEKQGEIIGNSELNNTHGCFRLAEGGVRRLSGTQVINS